MRIHYDDSNNFLGYSSDNQISDGVNYLVITDTSANAVAIKAGGIPTITGGEITTVTTATPDTTLSTLEADLLTAATFAEQQDILLEIELAKRGITKGTTALS